MDARRTADGIVVRLDYEEALVLSDMLSRWVEAKLVEEPGIVEDKAEKIVLWDLSASFEPLIDEAFSSDYRTIVAGARAVVAADGPRRPPGSAT